MSAMIPRTLPGDAHAQAPQQVPRTGVIRSLDALLRQARARGADDAELRSNCDDAPDFPLRVPLALLDQIENWTADDPVLRQVLPSPREHDAVPGYTTDPVGEAQHQDGALLRKYTGRALLVTTQACDVHCRYCFRRSFDYGNAQEAGNYDAAFASIAADTSIHELILSGGDPLTLSLRRLRNIVEAAEAIAHLETLRIHTRSAIVNPARVTKGLASLLANTRLQVICVVHANTVQELGPAAQASLQKLSASNAMLLNQAVLLAGVNDTAEAQIALSKRLLACGVLPYYLHQLDPVAGAAHFEVPDARARVMLESVRASLPGYLVPKLVRELPGASAKTPL